MAFWSLLLILYVVHTMILLLVRFHFLPTKAMKRYYELYTTRDNLNELKFKFKFEARYPLPTIYLWGTEKMIFFPTKYFSCLPYALKPHLRELVFYIYSWYSLSNEHQDSMKGICLTPIQYLLGLWCYWYSWMLKFNNLTFSNSATYFMSLKVSKRSCYNMFFLLFFALFYTCNDWKGHKKLF